MPKLKDGWAIAVRDQTASTKYPILWQTMEGERLFFEEMRTTHLFFSLRMLFNHTSPPKYVIPGCKVYDMSRITIEQRTQGAACLLDELATRTDLSAKWREQLDYMVEASKKIATKKLYDSNCDRRV